MFHVAEGEAEEVDEDEDEDEDEEVNEDEDDKRRRRERQRHRPGFVSFRFFFSLAPVEFQQAPGSISARTDRNGRPVAAKSRKTALDSIAKRYDDAGVVCYE
ncbi:hypothetical protein H109_05561 [Trichophyton interdigitale MR816]|uniref:Uncharacterized protein n=1 Tax=Trichophyton interdigitale (strain MR816) TaxID=1215338 RepID=A0A059J4W1_TRIIM|nr:hypothetical protein H109_05561 [Trichophyton interdigitale MR816]